MMVQPNGANDMKASANQGVVVLHLGEEKPCRWRAQRRRVGKNMQYRYLRADMIPAEWTPWSEWDDMCATLYEVYGGRAIICYMPV
jgi:hypothetical protein